MAVDEDGSPKNLKLLEVSRKAFLMYLNESIAERQQQ